MKITNEEIFMLFNNDSLYEDTHTYNIKTYFNQMAFKKAIQLGKIFNLSFSYKYYFHFHKRNHE